MEAKNREFDQLIDQITHASTLGQLAYVPMSAWVGHVPAMKFLIAIQQPDIFVELGTHHGLSYFSACEEIKRTNLRTKSYAVDNWQGDKHAGFYDETVFEAVNEENSKYTSFSTLLRMDFAEAVTYFEDLTIDLLHIDGEHTYDAVSRDFNSWLPKMKPNGVILLHDIHVRREDFGVYKFWAELKAKYQTLEFTNSYGLGVLFLAENALSSNLRTLSNLNEAELLILQGALNVHSSDLLGNIMFSFDKNSLVEERDTAIQERDTAIQERDTAIQERDTAIQERDTAIQERDVMFYSKSWRITKPLRVIKQSLRN
jgi:hypothetical protein